LANGFGSRLQAKLGGSQALHGTGPFVDMNPEAESVSLGLGMHVFII
jgi:hypothetical protein